MPFDPITSWCTDDSHRTRRSSQRFVRRSRRRRPRLPPRRRPAPSTTAPAPPFGQDDGESACKRDPVLALRRWVAIHLVRPTRRLSHRCRCGGRAARASCSALLRVGFAEPPGSPRTLVRSYRTVSPSPVAGRPAHRRSLSVALSVRSPRPGSRQHPALWSPDFPRRGDAGTSLAAATRPTHHQFRRLRARSQSSAVAPPML